MQILKKVFSFIGKILFEPEIERNTHCIYCGKKLIGSQRRFCNDKCNNTYWRNKYSKKHINNIERGLKNNE